MASASREKIQRAALLASTTGQSFEDVKFFAFSRCTRNDGIDTPLPLFANSALIRKASSHFDFGESSRLQQHTLKLNLISDGLHQCLGRGSRRAESPT